MSPLNLSVRHLIGSNRTIRTGKWLHFQRSHRGRHPNQALTGRWSEFLSVATSYQATYLLSILPQSAPKSIRPGYLRVVDASSTRALTPNAHRRGWLPSRPRRVLNDRVAMNPTRSRAVQSRFVGADWPGDSWGRVPPSQLRVGSGWVAKLRPSRKAPARPAKRLQIFGIYRFRRVINNAAKPIPLNAMVVGSGTRMLSRTGQDSVVDGR